MKRGVAAAIALALALIACSRETPSRTAAARLAELNNPASSSDGARVYITNCSSCHQLDGRGVPGAFPALAGDPVVTGDPGRVISIVKFGRRRSAQSGAFGGVMPAWNGLLSDGDIAAVVTYIRFAWHNRANPVTRAQVEAASP
ncbi:MAG: cytochrome c [Candidatus Tumulicola sp.]